MVNPPTAPSHWGRQQEDVAHPSPPQKGLVGSLIDNVKTVAGTTLHIAQLALSETKPVQAAQSTLEQGEHALHSLFEQIKDNTLARDALTILRAGVQSVKPLDDRKLLLEQIIVLLSTLPPDSPVGPVLQNAFIRVLWMDIPKPPATLIGPYQHRTADGSGNNVFSLDVGKANMPYARTVPPIHPVPRNLPDVDLVWETLLKQDKFTPHPSGISPLLFSFAVLITHSIFQTNHDEPAYNETSSYLDLAPIYGNNEAEQKQVRLGENGLLHADTIASRRLFLMTPAAVALAIVFARNHNWIAKKLFEVNENDVYQPWDQLDEDGKAKQDEDIFQKARMINCGHFVAVIFQDYIRAILAINRTTSTWSLVPTGEIKDAFQGPLPRGTGNHVSAEFNILYRWHMAMSKEDAAWLERLMHKHSKVKPENMTPDDFRAAYESVAAELGDNPRRWTFNNLKRTGPDGEGPFRDDDIVKTLTDGTIWKAGAFKARGIPDIFAVIDKMGMVAARNTWQVASLNEFRRMLGLKEYTDFSEWNPDKDIAETARRLYKHVDNLELYPGLMAEQPKPSREGSGLAPGYTISRAILSDAAALVRGDRFLTHDYNVATLTSYHFQDLQPDLDNGAFGGHICKLLFRLFPGHYTYDSVYALFPFTNPDTTRGILEKLNIEDRYSFTKPSHAPHWVKVTTYDGARHVLNRPASFDNVYGPALAEVSGKEEESLLTMFKNATEGPSQQTFSETLDAVFFPSNFAQLALTRIGDMTKQQMEWCSWKYGKGEHLRVDVVGDVFVPVVSQYIADICGVPLKTKHNALGLWTPTQFFEVLSEIYSFVYLKCVLSSSSAAPPTDLSLRPRSFDPSVGFKLRDRVIKNARTIRLIIEGRLMQASGFIGQLGELVGDIKNLIMPSRGQGFVMSDTAREFYHRVIRSTDRPAAELAGVILIGAVRLVTCVSQAANVLDFYLKPEQEKNLKKVLQAAQRHTNIADDATLLHYVEEALRLQPAVYGTARRAKGDMHIKDGDKDHHVKKGQHVWVDIVSANLDAEHFPKPNEVHENRDITGYTFNQKVSSLTNTRNESLNSTLVTGLIREAAQRDIKRAEGAAGQLGRINAADDFCPAYVRAEGPPTAFPSSMDVIFTGKKNVVYGGYEK
ncbi:hypothetical protein JCM10021v2_003756 [Rhodotorula toruloides]